MYESDDKCDKWKDSLNKRETLDLSFSQTGETASVGVAHIPRVACQAAVPTPTADLHQPQARRLPGVADPALLQVRQAGDLESTGRRHVCQLRPSSDVDLEHNKERGFPYSTKLKLYL